MSGSMLLAIARNLVSDSTSRRFAFGVSAGLGFSLAVILSTMGIMDGFEAQLRQKLRTHVGDLTLLSSKGLFPEGKATEVARNLKHEGSVAGLLKVESFLLHGEHSRAILLIGAGQQALNSLLKKSDDDANSLDEESMPLLWTGNILYQELRLQEQEQVTLALARGASSAGGLPTLAPFRLMGAVEHGVHEKDLRVAYTSLTSLQERSDAIGQINAISIHLSGAGLDMDELHRLGRRLSSELGTDFQYRTYTSEYGTLLEAVQIEKWMITLILQVIVVISVFNVFAFLTFINEQKSTVLFLVRALGLNRFQLLGLWGLIVGVLWSAGCLLAIIFEWGFELLVTHLGLIELPSDIYHLSSLSMIAPWQYHIPIFFAALIWILIFGYWYSRRYRGKAVMMGLRKEFA